MDDNQDLNQLESAGDWQGLAKALEAAIEVEEDAAQKSRYFLRLGVVMNEKLLQGPRALRYFQNAWKLKPEDVQPLIQAGEIYWDLGKFKMVDTVLRRSLEAADGQQRSHLLINLGNVSCDLGNYDAAREHYAAAVRLGGDVDHPRNCLEDVSLQQCEEAERIGSLVGDAAELGQGRGGQVHVEP